MNLLFIYTMITLYALSSQLQLSAIQWRYEKAVHGCIYDKGRPVGARLCDRDLDLIYAQA